MKTDLVVTGYVFSNGKLLLIHHAKLNLWLPVGGHIDENEVPDDALLREIKEETNLDAHILGRSSIPLVGNVRRNLCAPFHVNVHPVKDHDHCSFFYACHAPHPEQLSINKELKGYRWVSEQELHSPDIPADVQTIGKRAIAFYHEHRHEISE